MKQRKSFKGALVLLALLLGLVSGHALASEALADKITKYLEVAQQNILPDSPFYASKNLSRRLDRAFTFNSGDRTIVDSNKLNEIIRELADAHIGGSSKSLDNKILEIYSDWSNYLKGDFSKIRGNLETSSRLASNIITQSLKQIVVINELEKDGLDPLIAESFRTAIVENLTLSLRVLGGIKWTAITLDSATALTDTITKKDILDSLDKIVLTTEDVSLRNLLKGVIINLAGLNS
ncbi:MAG: hypothetical protein NTX26_01790 [Candidatus Parcubacteria bacterium]|nr:hypothetical protein [Candidatus Parcubacteria bacterium]